MPKSRRQFLAVSSLGALGAAATFHSQAQNPADLPPGAPPAFGTAPPVGPEVSPTTLAEAEKLLHSLGYRECRVRLHEGELARIEVPAGELA